MKRGRRLSVSLMLLLLLGVLGLTGRNEGATPLGTADAGTVVLLHGLGRTPRSFSGMAKHLRGEGYDVVNLGYPSRSEPIEGLVTNLAPRLDRVFAEQGTNEVYFVTHSLGGILLRTYLEERGCKGVGRVVMLSPPSQGSGVTDHYRSNLVYQFYTGPAGQQLGSEAGSVPNQLAPIAFELGVITGNRTLNPLLSKAIPGPDDGKVAVDKARVEGMKDFLVVPYSHTYIMSRQRVQEQVVHFLRTGAFEEKE